MSLSGLDTDTVKKAYETTVADPTGWFLLQYATRAEVELRNQGSGGFVEAREAIAQYGEPSPLFGLVLYRRKKVLLKYVPEDTSRLLQARLSVHVQSVIEAFTHDALLSLTTASDLTETALSSSISSLKSSSSVKSTTGRTHKPLSEILEDGSETITAQQILRNLSQTEEVVEPTEGLNTQVNGRRPEVDSSTAATSDVAVRPPRTSSLENIKANSTERPSTAIPTKRAQEEDRISLRASLDDSRPTTQSSTSPAKDTYVPYRYKPKVKLGPRPSIDAGQASRKSGSFSRPVSTLPAGVTMPQRKPLAFERPATQQAASKPFFPESARIIDMSSSASAMGDSDRPNSSHGSIATVPAYTHYPEPHSPSFPAVSLEKQRLMKALQQRKKYQQNRKALHEFEIPSSTPSQHIEAESNHTGESPVSEPPTMEDKASEVVVKEEPVSFESPATEIKTEPVGNVDSHEGHKRSESPQASSELVKSSAGMPVKATSSEPVEQSARDLLSGVKPEPTPQELDSSRSTDVDQPASGAAGDVDQAANLLSVGTGKTDDTVPVSPDHSNSERPKEHQGLAEAEEDSHNVEGLAPQPQEAAPLDQRSTQDFSKSDPETASQRTVTLPVAAGKAEQPPLTQDQKTEESSEIAMKKEEPLDDNAESPTAPTITQKDLTEGTKDSGIDGLHADPSPHTTDKKKRPEPLESLKFDSSSDAGSISGDSFMEELSSATLQEATPMIVSRSPATPVFPLSRRSSETSRLGRTVTSPIDGDAPPMPSITPELKKTMSDSASVRLIETQSIRSVSNPIDALPAMPADRGLSAGSVGRLASRASSVSPSPEKAGVERQSSKKTGVSSLISSRIKALEKLSTSSPQQNATTHLVTPSLVSKRKTSLTTPPSSAGTDTIRKRDSRAYPTPSPSPHNFVARTFGSRKAPSSSPAPEPKQKPEISITTTLSPPARRPTLDRAQDSEMSLNESIVSSPPVIQTDPSSSSWFPKSSKKAKSKKGSVSSISSAVLETLSSPSRNSFSSKRSTTSRRSSGETVRPPISPFSSASDTKSSKGSNEKKESKKSRLLRRMSSMSFSPRKNNALSPTLNDQPIIEGTEPEASKKWAPMALGDVNVQFPDTLLWKRRYFEIDSHGYLILAASKMDKKSKITTKRYHISEFRAPYMPDQDREELPFSVILDFHDNSTLQCACEHTQGQLEVSKILADCHAVFNSKGRS